MAWPLGWFCYAFSVCAVCIVDENQRIDFITGSHFSFSLSLFHSILRISFRHCKSCMLRWLASIQDYAFRFKRHCRSFYFSISIALSCIHWFRRLATLMLIARVCAYACGAFEPNMCSSSWFQQNKSSPVTCKPDKLLNHFDRFRCSVLLFSPRSAMQSVAFVLFVI